MSGKTGAGECRLVVLGRTGVGKSGKMIWNNVFRSFLSNIALELFEELQLIVQ